MRYIAGPRGIKLDIDGTVKTYGPGDLIPDGVRLRNVKALMQMKKIAHADDTVLVAGRKGLKIQEDNGTLGKYEHGEKLPDDLKLRRTKFLESANKIEKVPKSWVKPKNPEPDKNPELKPKKKPIPAKKRR